MYAIRTSITPRAREKIDDEGYHQILRSVWAAMVAAGAKDIEPGKKLCLVLLAGSEAETGKIDFTKLRNSNVSS